MKKSILSLCFLLITVLLICCRKGDTGPAGSAGPQGPAGAAGAQGPQGIAGNANVTQYTYGTYNFATVSYANLAVTTTQDTMNNSAWFVYLIRPNGNVYPIPGYGVISASDYRLYWSYFTGKVLFAINRVSGPGEEYGSIRIIRIYADTTKPGGRAAQLPDDLDVNDYYAVCRYYDLPY